jgi:hypothetical protein
MLIFISLHLIAHFFSYYHHYTLDQHLATSRPYLLLTLLLMLLMSSYQLTVPPG